MKVAVRALQRNVCERNGQSVSDFEKQKGRGHKAIFQLAKRTEILCIPLQLALNANTQQALKPSSVC